MSEIIDKYNQISYEKISRNESVVEYETELFERINDLRSVYIGRNVFEILGHPVLVVKSMVEVGRLKNIDKKLEVRKNGSVMKFCHEESGDLDVDLIDYANRYKLRDVMEFIDENPIYGESKVLVRNRKKARIKQ